MAQPLADLAVSAASESDVAELYRLRCRTAEHLTRQYGPGRWTATGTERGIRRAVASSRVLVARHAGRPIGALNLQAQKPWAIDVSYFTPVSRALYLVDMRVDPSFARHGVGRRLIEEAMLVARDWPAGAVRLDAYDAAAGAGPFYVRCGFTEVGRAVYRTVPLVYFERLVPSRQD
jgi:GNAT superfamily N-acetyltransferase